MEFSCFFSPDKFSFNYPQSLSCLLTWFWTLKLWMALFDSESILSLLELLATFKVQTGRSSQLQIWDLSNCRSCFLQFCQLLDLKLGLKLTDQLQKRAAFLNIVELAHHFQLESLAHKSLYQYLQYLVKSKPHLHVRSVSVTHLFYLGQQEYCTKCIWAGLVPRSWSL